MEHLALAHHTLGRLREHVDSVAVALQAAHVESGTHLARSRRRPPVADPASRLADGLAPRLHAWMFAPPPALSGLDQLRALLVDPPPASAAPRLTPLAWHVTARAALSAMHDALDVLAVTADAAPIVEAFCAATLASLSARRA